VAENVSLCHAVGFLLCLSIAAWVANRTLGCPTASGSAFAGYVSVFSDNFQCWPEGHVAYASDSPDFKHFSSEDLGVSIPETACHILGLRYVPDHLGV
jgi:hypothetical protein